MTVRFTEEELEYIDKTPFKWTVAEDAPEEITKAINRKLKLLNADADREIKLDSKTGKTPLSAGRLRYKLAEIYRNATSILL